MSAVRTAPPAAAAALLYAVVKAPCAVPATASPAWNPPVIVPGGNPVIEAPGLIPTSPVTIVGPMLLTTGVAPRIPNPHADPNTRDEGATHAVGVVAKVHTRFAASGLPNVSVAPVVIVAV